MSWSWHFTCNPLKAQGTTFSFLRSLCSEFWACDLRWPCRPCRPCWASQKEGSVNIALACHWRLTQSKRSLGIRHGWLWTGCDASQCLHQFLALQISTRLTIPGVYNQFLLTDGSSFTDFQYIQISCSDTQRDFDPPGLTDSEEQRLCLFWKQEGKHGYCNGWLRDSSWIAIWSLCEVGAFMGRCICGSPPLVGGDWKGWRGVCEGAMPVGDWGAHDFVFTMYIEGRHIKYHNVWSDLGYLGEWNLREWNGPLRKNRFLKPSGKNCCVKFASCCGQRHSSLTWELEIIFGQVSATKPPPGIVTPPPNGGKLVSKFFPTMSETNQVRNYSKICPEFKVTVFLCFKDLDENFGFINIGNIICLQNCFQRIFTSLAFKIRLLVLPAVTGLFDLCVCVQLLDHLGRLNMNWLVEWRNQGDQLSILRR